MIETFQEVQLMKCKYLESSFKVSKDSPVSDFPTEYLCKLKMGDPLKTAQLNRYLSQRGIDADNSLDSCNFAKDGNFEDCPIRDWDNPRPALREKSKE
jgi:hypothetical protein